MAVKHVCIRDCYYMERYWSAGEVIEETAGFEGMPPNKHFAVKGGRLPKDAMPILIAGDDPRPTKEIRADLEAKHGVKMPKKASRKELFAAWVEAEKEAGESPGAKDPVKPEPTKDRSRVVAPSDYGKPMKLIAEMTPDEIDNTTKKEIADRIGANHTSYNKEELIEKAIEAGV